MNSSSLESVNKITVEKKRIFWLDFGKFIAILAVLLDHSSGLLYKTPLIQRATFFSVSLFILTSGITSYYSFLHKTRNAQKLNSAYI